MAALQYTPLPDRATKAIENFIPPDELINKRTAHFASVEIREPDKDGGTEKLDGVTFTHHFIEVPGDAGAILWHYVEAGAGEPMCFFMVSRILGFNGIIKCRPYQQPIVALTLISKAMANRRKKLVTTAMKVLQSSCTLC